MPMVDAETEELVEERRMKDQFMAHHRESPFVSAGIPGFRGLHYFPVDSRYRLSAQMIRSEHPEEAYLRTNRDGHAVMRYLGDLTFSLEGRSLRLRVYHAGEGVGTSAFIPFRDSTSGNETYGPGRYLTLELNPNDEYVLDFNHAFNPYCAYTDAFECGFPPAENDLPVAIRAGEKVWSAERNPRTPSTVVLDLVRGKSTSVKPRPRRKSRTKGPRLTRAGRPRSKRRAPPARKGRRKG